MKLTPVTDPTAIRVDTSVGKRIFVGDTMVYGETPWVVLASSSFPPLWGSALSIVVKRSSSFVEMNVTAFSMGDWTTQVDILHLPIGFRPHRAVFNATLNNRDMPGASVQIDMAATGVVTLRSKPVSGRHYGTFTWTSQDAWPVAI